MATLYDLQTLLNKAANSIPKETLIVMEVEGEQFIADNFAAEGFHTGSGVDKWPKRKTTDKRGRDITRYRTNRTGKAGSLNAYGRKNKGRAILVGHNTGGNKLKNSITTSRSRDKVTFRTYKEYAKRHNEGLKGMPQRQFMGKSPELDQRIAKKIKSLLNKKFNR